MYATLRPAAPAPGESFRVLHLVSPGFRPAWHQHAEYELNCVVRGSGTRWVGGVGAAFRPGDVVLVPPHTAHSWASEAGGPRASEAVVVLFRPEHLGLDAAVPEWRAALRMFDAARAGLAFRPDAALRRRLRGLPLLQGARRLLALLDVLDRLSREAWTPLARTGVAPSDDARALHVARRAMQLLEGAGGARLRQADVASRVGLTPSAFSRQFRLATGRTFSQHLDAHRIDRACRLLQRDELPITQVCFAAGFSNVSNFNRRFRLALGQSPRDYRHAFRRSMASAARAEPS